MELRPGYRQTEVGVIPEDWDCAPIGSVARLESGHTPSKRKPSYWGGSVQWVSLHDTAGLDGREIEATAKTITEEGLNHSSARLLPPGTVVFSRTATVGKSTVIARSMATSQDFANYVCGPDLHNYFLVYLFRSMRRTWQRFMAGSIHNTIYMPVFKALRIALPPVTEQRAIAAALSDVDALLGGLERLIAKKRDLKQAAMQQLLAGQTRLPGFNGEWEVKRLGEIAKIQRGASPRPIDSPVWFDENSSIGWVRISDVTSSGIFLYATTQRLSPLGVKNSRPVASRSLIMSICATVGRPVITKIDVCIHDGFVVFDNLEANQLFLYYVLKAIEPDWSKQGQTGSQMNLNTGLINGTPIKLPPVAEQTAIAAVLSDMDAELSALEARRDKTRALKQGMMQELLTGRIRLVAASSNVVSVDFASIQKHAPSYPKSHNWQFNEAVVVAMLVKQFGSDQYPLGRKRCTKLGYLMHRHVERAAQGYLKKTAGPYNPAIKYKGPETIAQKNGYIRPHTSGKFSGFVAAGKIAEAEGYFDKWYGREVLAWLEQFRHQTNDELELLATVDMAIVDVKRVQAEADVAAVKSIILDHPEWKAKLEREIFSDANIARAIGRVTELFAE